MGTTRRTKDGSRRAFSAQSPSSNPVPSAFSGCLSFRESFNFLFASTTALSPSLWASRTRPTPVARQCTGPHVIFVPPVPMRARLRSSLPLRSLPVSRSSKRFARFLSTAFGHTPFPLRTMQLRYSVGYGDRGCFEEMWCFIGACARHNPLFLW